MAYRSTDDFIKSTRTTLARIIADCELRPGHRLGFGYAYFEHYGSNRVYENRPFIQYSFERSNGRSSFRLRFRNELRAFKGQYLLNRNRLQGSVIFLNSRMIQPNLSSELFFTPGKNQSIEQRYQTGVQLNINQLQINLFYMLQIQSSVHYLQHMIGYQINVNIN